MFVSPSQCPKRAEKASLSTASGICYIKENESERIKLKDDMEVECGYSNIHIQSFGI
jgi:hypothetical protein